MLKFLFFALLLTDFANSQTCRKIHNCPQVFNSFKLKNTQPIICDEEEETVMCPAISTNIEEKKCIQYLKSILVYDEDEEEYVDKCSTLAVPYIIGGTAAMPHEFPHQALLENGNDQWFCGGTLVSEKFVLTAAHCLQKNPTSVIFGIHNIVNLLDEDENELETMQKIDVKRMFIHPAYKKPEVYNDIGLIELTRRVKLTPYVRPICLPTATEYKYLEKLTVTGYGLTENASSKDDLIDVLQKVELPHVSNEACKKIYNRPYVDTSKSLPHGPLPEKQICYGGKAGQDACYGDSGGPLQRVHKTVYCSYVLIGITASGVRCDSNVPGIYTNVLPYMDWIKKKIWS